jgi:hypothetical protein
VVDVHHFGQLDDRTLERDHVRVGVPHQPDADEHRRPRPTTAGSISAR